MNTPAHVIFSLALLGRPNASRYVIAIMVGALLPDIAMIAFYFWHNIIGTSESLIWSHHYFLPGWQNLFDLANSIPLVLIGLGLSIWQGKRWLTFLFASMLIHCLLDLIVHHDDAHRHFFPFSHWRFVSPYSYWNPDYHGDVIGKLEVVFFWLLAGWLWCYSRGQIRVFGLSQLRCVLIAFGVIYAVYFWFVFQTWM